MSTSECAVDAQDMLSCSFDVEEKVEMMEMVGTKQMTSPSSFRCGPIRERGEQGWDPEVLSDSRWGP